MVYTSKILTRANLKAFILRQLGDPVIDVNVTDAQLDDAIDTTIDRFVEKAADGTEFRFATLNVIENQQTYILNNDVYAITAIYNQLSYSIQTVFPLQTVADFNVLTYTNKDLLTGYLARQYFENFEHMNAIPLNYDFNGYTKQLYFPVLPVGSTSFGYFYYARVDNSDTSSIYSNLWIQNYSTALARVQWGNNLSKFSGVLLPDGTTLQSDLILNNGKEAVEKLEQQLDEELQQPPGFFVG